MLCLLMKMVLSSSIFDILIYPGVEGTFSSKDNDQWQISAEHNYLFESSTYSCSSKPAAEAFSFDF